VLQILLNLKTALFQNVFCGVASQATRERRSRFESLQGSTTYVGKS
jgi:hypothetical protein